MAAQRKCILESLSEGRHDHGEAAPQCPALTRPHLEWSVQCGDHKQGGSQAPGSKSEAGSLSEPRVRKPWEEPGRWNLEKGNPITRGAFTGC